MDQPLVSIICLCFNQAEFVSAAIASVAKQVYPNFELIVVDDSSEDQSVEVIRSSIKDLTFPVKTIFNTSNQGNCAAFNVGLKLAKGKYIIDLAADDIILPDRIMVGVMALEKLPEHYGVHYCEANHIDRHGNLIKVSENIKPTKLEGDIYLELIQHYWINAATMLIKKSVLNSLNGYDESLTYEDFDFWIRSARNHHYAYSNALLVQKRVVVNSLGYQQNRFRNRHETSTYRICLKIKELNKSVNEDRALRKRLLYEIGKCLRLGHLELAIKYWRLRITL